VPGIIVGAGDALADLTEYFEVSELSGAADIITAQSAIGKLLANSSV
jgi:hypothetical protein